MVVVGHATFQKNVCIDSSEEIIIMHQEGDKIVFFFVYQ
jgi:hypothetical protein